MDFPLPKPRPLILACAGSRQELGDNLARAAYLVIRGTSLDQPQQDLPLGVEHAFGPTELRKSSIPRNCEGYDRMKIVGSIEWADVGDLPLGGPVASRPQPLLNRLHPVADRPTSGGGGRRSPRRGL